MIPTDGHALIGSVLRCYNLATTRHKFCAPRLLAVLTAQSMLGGHTATGSLARCKSSTTARHARSQTKTLRTTTTTTTTTTHYHHRDRHHHSHRQGPVHFLNLNTEMASTNGSRQFAFVDADLAAVDRTATPWVFVFGHRQMYSANAVTPQNDLGDLEPLMLK